MKPDELHKRVAEILGVSASQKHLAFDVLIESVSGILTEGITLKIPRIGFFQLKTDSQKDNFTKQLMFSSLPEDFDPSEKILYHTFDVSTKYKNSAEIDSQVFSIGVGKPLLPLHDEESLHDSETSFAMLRKSIEERVREILAESDQIPNLNIWEDLYYNNEDDLHFEEDISSKLFDLTKDLHFNEGRIIVDAEIEPQHQNFLNSLLYNEKPEASEEFFAEEKKEEFSFNGNYGREQFAADDLYIIDETQPEKNLSVADLLGDVDLEPKVVLDDDFKQEVMNIELKQVIENVPILEDKIEISIPDNFTSQVKIDSTDEISSHYFVEEIEFGKELGVVKVKSSVPTEEETEVDIESIESAAVSDSHSGEVLRSLLNDEELPESENRNSEITIEPPTSAKELLITLKENINDADKNAWVIAEEDLKGIINDELKEYDHEKIANDNSRVLNDLLEDAFHRKVDMDSTDESEEEISVDIANEQNASTEKIEWSWGDELKEEFGIGQEEAIEILPESSLQYEEDEAVQSETDNHKFDIEKTRRDLFSKLEKTLAQEITSLHENYDNSFNHKHVQQHTQFEKYANLKPELNTELRKTKTHVEETKPVVEFKDEKVILDFKTPPPRYEFIEETTAQNIEQDFPDEPVLTKPKRMTILLERTEIESAVTNAAEAQGALYEEVATPKKYQNHFGKLFVITLAFFIVVTSIAVYLYIRNISSVNQVEADQTSQFDNQVVPSTVDDNAAVQNIRESLGLNPDDFSEFPTTATPPEPIKEGNTVDVTKLLQKATDNTKPKNEEIVEQAQQEDLRNKSLAANTAKPAGETRLSNMVFFDGKSYNFQISSWKNKLLAQNEVDRLRSLGFNAFLVEAFLPDKGGTWYRIRIGSFKSEQEAVAFKKKNSF
ncbi:MAG: hypothetical protein FD143_2470 [Ignavibacteria bacterium]|nr:MAG: hypothetical protein FD143_2470 [Ignavibacteria bacterium]KAF0157277.1 MAG: hypothetical protein FD188_2795 [Ignavibacteria bacterium]